MRKLLLTVAVVSLVVMLPGCSSLGGLFGTQGESGPDPQLVQQYTEAKANLEQLKANATADITKAVAEGDAKLEAKARETVKTVQDIQSKVAAVEKVVKVDAAGNVDAGATLIAVGGALPPPWNLLVLVGGPLIVGGIQEWRRRGAVADTKSVINSVDVLMTKNEAVKSALKNVDAETKAAAHEQLTPAAKKLINAESVT